MEQVHGGRITITITTGRTRGPARSMTPAIGSYKRGNFTPELLWIHRPDLPFCDKLLEETMVEKRVVELDLWGDDNSKLPAITVTGGLAF